MADTVVIVLINKQSTEMRLNLSIQTSPILLTILLLSGCSMKSQLAESCIEPGKIYRNLGSLKRNFIDIDSTLLPGIIKLSEALPDKWIRYSAEFDSLEIRVIDFSSIQNGRHSYNFATLHKHIVFPTYPKKSQVKLPCTIEIFFETEYKNISSDISLEIKIRKGDFKQVYGHWEWNKSTNRIEFTEEGANNPTIYWDMDH